MNSPKPYREENPTEKTEGTKNPILFYFLVLLLLFLALYLAGNTDFNINNAHNLNYK